MSDTYNPNAALGDLAITYNGQITPPAPSVFGPSATSSESVIPGFLTSGALDTGNGATSAIETAFAGGGSSGPGALVLAGGAALALIILLMPTSSGSRRR